MSNIYTSKYPTIVTDKSTNSVNESMIKKMTVEEYYDLKHHTHSISQLTVDEGSMTYAQMQELVTVMNQTIDNLNTIVEQQQNTIKEQNDIIQKLEADTSELQEAIQSINSEISNMASVSDWDVETPGNQDINGNDLGTLMGFTMTEIQE